MVRALNGPLGEPSIMNFIEGSVRQIDEVINIESWLHLVSKLRSILGADPYSYQSPRIAENGVADVRVKLMQVLMRDHETEAVLA